MSRIRRGLLCGFILVIAMFILVSIALPQANFSYWAPSLLQSFQTPIWQFPVNRKGDIRSGYLPFSYLMPANLSHWAPSLLQSFRTPIIWQVPINGEWDIRSGYPNFSYLMPWNNPAAYAFITSWANSWDYYSALSKKQPVTKQPEIALPFFENPKLIKLGPLYAQFNEPYRYLFIADYSCAKILVHDQDGHVSENSNIRDLMLNLDHFITDPNEIMAYWIGLGADPNRFGLVPDPVISLLFDPDGKREFIVDPQLPIFVDPNLRIRGAMAQYLIGKGTLSWNVTVKYAAEEVPHLIQLQPLSVDPYDGMPTYLPAYDALLDVFKRIGEPYYGPSHVFVLESALWNAGFTVWPNIAALDVKAQSFEDMILSIEVSNGVDSDVSTFPISVVNCPIYNYSPVPESEDIELTFYVGANNEYVLRCIDPDCFIFSMSESPIDHMPATGIPPTAENFRTDMASLYWEPYPLYSYCPSYTEDDYCDPDSYREGLIYWVPTFEDVYDTFLLCKDSLGGQASVALKIVAVARDPNEVNHPPTPTILSPSPQPNAPPHPVLLIKAGEEFILNIAVEDPDGDAIFASCNIGECKRALDGSFMWKFRSNFPGSYLVEIVFNDTRGGYALMEFFLDVKPWWVY